MTIGLKPKVSFTPSAYQQDIFDWVASGIGNKNNLIVEAVAGSGKTKTGIEVFNLLPQELDSAFVAFNKHIADELKAKLPEGSNAKTYHSLGFSTLRKTFGQVNTKLDKIEIYLKQRYPNQRWLFSAVKKLVGLCKGTGQLNFTSRDLETLAFSHDIDLYEEKGIDIPYQIFAMTLDALRFSIENPQIVDFDDMIWLPNVLDTVSFYEYDFLFVDEVQDTNMAQMYLASRSIHNDGMIVGVGDRKQSIYRFRGADETAMDRLRDALEADELPLSISYRCPVKIRELVNQKFPEIKFEVPEWAKEGTIRNIMNYDLYKEVKPDDMILCRVNADLVTACFALIRSGVKATIKGRDIGKGLVALINKSHATYVTDLLDWMFRWKDAEVQKAFRLGQESKLQLIEDKFETLFALTEGTDLVAEVAQRCDAMFSDEKAGVTLSTIHRAKGLEAERVYVLRPDLIPHPAAKSDVDKNQERNLEYVAITRSKDELVYVQN